MASIPGTSGEESWRAMPRPLSRFFSKGSSEMKQREKELEGKFRQIQESSANDKRT